MKTFTPSMKTASVLKFAIVTSLIFAFGIIQAVAQVVITTNSDGTKTLNSSTAVQQPADSTKALPVGANATTSGLHAPDPNDPDYATKKAEWAKNYPDEYKASLPAGSPAGFGGGNGTITMAIKLGEHAPEPNDPDYITKYQEWIKNYPDEYKASLAAGTPAGTNTTTNKLGEHAPDPSDPDYDTKKAEWKKNYPDEYLKATQAPTDKK